MNNAKIRIISKKFDIKKHERPKFPISNECFTPIKATLNSLIGLDYYLGICGGGTQNIYLLSQLLLHNRFKKLALIDTKLVELDNFRYVAKAYNKTNDDLHYFASLIKHYKRFNINDALPYYRFFWPSFFYDSFIFEETNFKKELPKNIIVHLEQADIFKQISNNDLPIGKYFIYLSNGLTYKWWQRIEYKLRFWRESYPNYLNYIYPKIAPKILENNKILEGSVILVYASFLLGDKEKFIILFRKSKKKLNIIKVKKIKGSYRADKKNTIKTIKIRVCGDSMRPTLKFMDVIEVAPIKDCKYNNVKVGDIVSYHSKGFNREGKPRFWHKATVIHRVVGKKRNYALIKGDNRGYKEKVSYDEIVGIVINKK
jgi:hypothetical protein